VKANERAIKGCQTGCGNSLLDCGQEELAAWRAQERAKYRLPYFAFLLLRCSFCLMMFDAFAFILLQCSRCSRAKAVPVQGSRSWGDDEALAAEAASTG